MQIADHLRQLEERLLDPAVRKDPALVSQFIADDFLEFGTSGRTFDKTAILEALSNEPIPPILLTHFAARPLAQDIVLVTYSTARHPPPTSPTVSANRSSIWVHRDDRWQITFHQGTTIPAK